MKNILLAINLSDEYYKALKDSNDIKKENEEMEKEIFDIKHEMLTMQSELDKANEQIKKLRSLLGRFLFRGDDVFLRVGDLSGGEKARLSLLKLMHWRSQYSASLTNLQTTW